MKATMCEKKNNRPNCVKIRKIFVDFTSNNFPVWVGHSHFFFFFFLFCVLSPHPCGQDKSWQFWDGEHVCRVCSNSLGEKQWGNESE